ncbi:LysR family transcriptional regulator [Luteibacter aegosomatissinici]|uniref:LysR family transcriptional regulator n=1 Tax=Luteibacter aegosomatissinici TaxID=2911539 RepID=UPI001FF85CA4|nr:LysR family transcriptional regulator [Luteibacter aegosomatissinici]UPG96016.1 LysR family transcriptional regulator [Luteibacter aegosomatissinici]
MANDINLNRLAVFVTLIRAGSFTAAAEQLGTTKAMVSQHLAKLEEELGMTLVLRSTRKMSLTDAGERFYEDCARVVADAEAAITRLGECRDTPMGTLRIAAAGDHGPFIVAPALAEYVRRYPQVRPELVVSDTIVDLIAERFDVAIRIGWLRDSSLRSAKLADVRQCLVATPAYLAEHGVPATPEALAKHRWVALTVLPSPTRWTFTDAAGEAKAVQVDPVASANSTLAVHALVMAGVGIAVLPDYVAHDDLVAGRLVALLPGQQLPTGGVYAVYAGQPTVKVRSFIDLLKERMGVP